jgi:putative nucleotidyltransferase with HDIG domain
VSELADKYRIPTPPAAPQASRPPVPAAGQPPRPPAQGPGQAAAVRPAAAPPVPLAVRLEKEIREGRVELPVLPQVAVEVQQLMDREADLPSLVHTIEREPTVAAALIKYANAAMYAGLRDVTDLQQALLRLGLASVRQAVLSISAKSAFKADDARQQKLYETIWLHSMTTAVAARRLAAFVSVPPETAFLAGLLHDIGRIVVLRGISSLRRRDPTGFRVPEHTIGEFTDALHCSIGDVFCRAWNIPSELRDAITRHHDTALTEPKDALPALVQIADLMAAKVGASLKPDPDVKLLDRPAFVLLGLDDVRVASLLVDLEDERATLSSIF